MLREPHDSECIVPTQPPVIRPATVSDVPTILGLIHELAVFEKLEHEFKTTEAELREHLFGPRPYAEVLIASLEDQPVGFALFFHNYSTFLSKPGIYLEDLYVREAVRAHGVGTALLEAVRHLAVERGCGRFEWSVLNWNKRAIEFYEKMGAKPMSEWTIYRLTGEALLR
jgi:GNAT superfamily N-acetyltransferase